MNQDFLLSEHEPDSTFMAEVASRHIWARSTNPFFANKAKEAEPRAIPVAECIAIYLAEKEYLEAKLKENANILCILRDEAQ